MGKPRTELQTILEDILGTDHVYFQPPSNITMSYPAIVYQKDWARADRADNATYVHTWRYMVTVIDKDPDSLVLDQIAALPATTYVRHFAVDNLNHDIFDVYF